MPIRLRSPPALPRFATNDVDGTSRHARVLRPTVSTEHRVKTARSGERKPLLDETEAAELYRTADSRPRERRRLAQAARRTAARRTLEVKLDACRV